MTNRFDRYLNVNNHSSIDLPYVTLFDPDKESSYAIARDLIEAGAPGLILGLPFSDPCADTVAQANASQRALRAGATIEGALELIARIRAVALKCPLALVTYLNPAVVYGFDHFTQKIAKAGIDALLLPDLPSSMRLQVPTFDEAAQSAQLILGTYLTPQTSVETREKMLLKTRGFIVTRHSDGAQSLPFGVILTDEIVLFCEKNGQYCNHLRQKLIASLARPSKVLTPATVDLID